MTSASPTSPEVLQSLPTDHPIAIEPSEPTNATGPAAVTSDSNGPGPQSDLLNDDLGDLPEAVTEAPSEPSREPSPEDSAPKPDLPPPNPNAQIRIKTDNGKIWMLLPPELKKEGSTISYAWSELLQQLQQRLNGDARSWQPDTPVRLLTNDRLLDSPQFQDLATVLAQSNLVIKRIYTSRRRTAIAAASLGYSVEQTQVKQSLTTRSADGKILADPLYLQLTLRSGAEVRHEGSVIIMGDMNPGSSVVADGDIIVWGKLRGTVHAGASGNAGAIVLATQMQPAQIRIADFVARGPSGVPDQFFPEVAYVTPQGKISIASS
jgi:septum site-determining protein MinC